MNIVVEPKATVAAAPAPAAPAPPDDSVLVRAALAKFSAALAARDVSAMKAIWPTMTSSQEKGFRSFFKNNRGASISDSCDPSSLSISGSSATWGCSETTTIMAGGRPNRSEHGIRFALKKSGGNWIITDRR